PLWPLFKSRLNMSTAFALSLDCMVARVGFNNGVTDMRAIIKILIFPLIALLAGASFSHAQIYPLGFTDAEIKKVHSDLFEDDGKVLWPISKEAINKVISWNQADRETKI